MVPRSGQRLRGLPAPAHSGQRPGGFGSYKADPDGGHTPFAIQVIEVSGDRIVGHHNFVDPALFPVFGLPTHLDD